ncbi:unnamed protein product [Prunus armeniaca]
MTSEEAWTGRKPAVDHFRIFGCLAYAHVLDQKRGKLDDKSVKCVLLGVSEVSKAYMLYNPVTQKIIISRDVVFDEGSSWNWSNTVSESIPFDLDINDERRTDAQILEDILPNVPTSENITEHKAQTSRDTMSNVSANEPSEGQPSNSDTQRIRKRPVWMIDYVSGDELSDDDNVAHHALFADSDPVLFEDAINNIKWRKAMDAEIEAIEKNDTWELTDLPAEEKTIGVKWIFKTKLNEKGEVDKYKARLVAKGYKQEYGVDYAEVFAPVARLDTIRLVVSLAAQNYWPVYQLDVKSAFLHGELNEKVFIDQPPGSVQKGNEKKVFKLKKALYGLKQAPRAWYSRIDAYFSKVGFQKCPHEHTLFVKSGEGGKFLIVCLYVDDLLFTGNDEAMFVEFKSSMMSEFDMTDLGKMRYFLGIKVVQSSCGIFISQRKYAQEVLERF